MPLQSGRNDEAIRWIAMHLLKKPRAARYYDGNLNQSLVEQITPPGKQIKEQVQTALLNPHTDFPERYGGNRRVVFRQSVIQNPTSLRLTNGLMGKLIKASLRA